MRLIIIFIAIALSAGAFFLTMHLTSNKNAPQQMPVVEPQAQIQDNSTVNIYTAKQDIPIGTVISQDMLDFHPWPKNLLLPDMITADPSRPSEAVNMIARTPFQKGEPIIMNKLANEHDPSFLAASLGEGMRLVTIPVDAVSGAAGFVFPGDHVDVLITHDVANDISTITSDTKSVVKEPVTEVLVPDVRVMAVNQKSTAHGGDQPVVPATVSIEVSAADAQKIRLTENGNGNLSVALRALKEKNDAAPSRPSTIGDLSSVRALPDPGSQQIVVVRGVHADTVGVTRP